MLIDKTKMVDTSVMYPKAPKAWQCPVCSVGVRGDVEVCPNCVRRAGGTKVTIQEDELTIVRNFLGRWGYEVDVVKNNGRILAVVVVQAKSISE